MAFCLPWKVILTSILHPRISKILLILGMQRKTTRVLIDHRVAMEQTGHDIRMGMLTASGFLQRTFR